MSSDQIYAVLIPIHGDVVLLPNAAVAEVQAHEGLSPADGEAPSWCVGWIVHAGARVPVVSLEILSGRSVEFGQRSRLVVLHPVSTKPMPGQFALLAQGYPHLVTLTRNAVQREEALETDTEVALCRVKVGSQHAYIPDLHEIEERLRTWLQAD